MGLAPYRVREESLGACSPIAETWRPNSNCTFSVDDAAVQQHVEAAEKIVDVLDGGVFAVVFFLVAAYPWVLGRGGLQLWATAIGLGFAAVAMIAPAMLAPLNKLWFKFGALLHAAVSPVVLGAML